MKTCASEDVAAKRESVDGRGLLMIVDYYGLLGLEPGVDAARIEEALAQRQAEWAARMHEAGTGDLYRGHLAQIPALRRALLSTPAARAAYDSELTQSRQGTRTRQLDSLQRLVELRAAKGGLGVRDRQLLAAEAERRGVSKPELDRLLQPFPPWPEPPVDSDEHDALADDGMTHATERGRIRETLDRLGRRDLYDLLDLSFDAPADELSARLESALTTGVAPDAQQAQVWGQGLALAQAHLGTREARARYDRSLRADALDRLDEVLKFVLRGLSRLDPGTREALLQEAARLGVVPDHAERRLRAACRREGVAIEVPAGPPPIDVRRRWLRCRACSGLTEYSWAEIHASGHCRHCHAALRWTCPVCQKRPWVDEPQCRCGFRQCDAEPMRVHFEAAQHAFRLRKYSEAMTHLRQVQRYAPRHVGARKGVEKLQEQTREIRRLRAAYGLERATRRMVAARALVEQWSRHVSPFDVKLKAARAEVQAVLERAQELTVRARRKVDAEPAEARALYRQALTIATDLPEALEGLRRCPPDGPTDLVADVRSGRVRLRWTPPPPDGLGPLSFRVLRKPDAIPSHSDDGTLIAETHLPECEDGPLPAGRSFGYAVFGFRESVASLLGVATGPVVITDEVRNLRATPGPAAVELGWNLPPGAIGARVVRRVGSPVRSLRDGDAVDARRDGVLDTPLANGQTVHYAVYALFREPGGKLLPSRGVGISAIPGETPRPVLDLKAESLPDGATRLRWTATRSGRVRILRSEWPLAWVAGEARPATELDRLEGVWIDPLEPGLALDSDRVGPTVRFYTPLTLQDGQAILGEAVEHAHLLDPTHVRAVRDWTVPGRLTIRWSDPGGDAELSHRIVARANEWPEGPEDAKALRIDVDRAALAARGVVTLDLPLRQAAHAWHVVVHSVVRHAGQAWLSPGTSDSAHVLVPAGDPGAVVWYRLTLPAGGKGGSIRFHTNPSGAGFGPTLLVAASRLLPLRAGEGQVIAHFPAGRDGDQREFPSAVISPDRRLRLLADPDAGRQESVRAFLPDDTSG